MLTLDSEPAHDEPVRAVVTSDGTRFETYYLPDVGAAWDPKVWTYVKATYNGDTATTVWYQFDWSVEDYREYLALLSEDYREYLALLSEAKAETEAEIDYEY